MEYITVGRKYNEGKVAFVACEKNGSLDKIAIKDTCFLLLILTKGRLVFQFGGEKIFAAAPSFLCFDESENPLFLSESEAEYICIYFHPQFLNINMSFELLRSNKYVDLATTHDMFMLKPFFDKTNLVPILESQLEKIEHSAGCMMEELERQRDWFWSCRGRSHFMEIIIALERMYEVIGYGLTDHESEGKPIINNPKIHDAVLYMEGHYGENITLSDIAANTGVNHTTLTALMKQELGCTAMEYLMKCRISASKKQLAFTELPIKDIASLVGFKTVQHFNRVFKEQTNTTPAVFRKSAVQKRKEDWWGKEQSTKPR